MAILVVGVAIRLLSPAVFLDIGALWPIGAALLALGWVIRRIWPTAPLALAPVTPLVVFTWLVFSVSLHFTDIGSLPSRSADLRGPPVEQVGFSTLAVQMREGRLTVSTGTGPSAYQVEMTRRGGGAGLPLAVESAGDQGGEITIIDVRDPLPFDLDLPVQDNPWLRSAGWKVGLHPDPTWNLTLAAPEVSLDLRSVRLAGLAVAGQGDIKVGTTSTPTQIVLSGSFNIEVPAGVPVEVLGAAIVPEEWTVEGDTAWLGDRGAGWNITVMDESSAQILTAPG
ncbi:MAG: hypothetical protein OXI56_05525 [bacterium]|nr:hypothetical protein [bacterium]MDE0601239.1 hypothetical protein [bacterium]